MMNTCTCIHCTVHASIVCVIHDVNCSVLCILAYLKKDVFTGQKQGVQYTDLNLHIDNFLCVTTPGSGANKGYIMSSGHLSTHRTFNVTSRIDKHCHVITAHHLCTIYNVSTK